MPAAIKEKTIVCSGSATIVERPTSVNVTNNISLSEIPMAIEAPFLNPCSILFWIRRKKLGPIANMKTSPNNKPFIIAGMIDTISTE